MDLSTALTFIGPFLGIGGGVTLVLIAFLKLAGPSWIAHQFNERMAKVKSQTDENLQALRSEHDRGLQHIKSEQDKVMHALKSEQEHAIRFVQSTIDREIHRAKKLYDNEFTALSECWRLLRIAYDMSASTIASSTTDVRRMNDDDVAPRTLQVAR